MLCQTSDMEVDETTPAATPEAAPAEGGEETTEATPAVEEAPVETPAVEEAAPEAPAVE